MNGPAYSIYILTNKQTGKKYVSVRKCSQEKFRSLLRSNERNEHFASPIHQAWREYGEQAFVTHIHGTYATKAEARHAQAALIGEYQAQDECYNVIVPRDTSQTRAQTF